MKLPVASDKQVRQEVLKLAKVHKGLLTLTTLTQLGAALAAVAMPWLVGKLIDQVKAGTTSEVVMRYLWLFAAMAITMIVLSYIAEYSSRIMSERVFMGLRNQLVTSLLSMPLGLVESAGTGDLLGRVSHDVDKISFFLRRGLSEVLAIVAVVLATYTVAFTTSWKLAPVLLLNLVFMYFLGRWYFPRAVPAYRTESSVFATQNGHISENVEQIDTIEALGMVPLRRAQLRTLIENNLNNERYTAWLRVGLLGGIMLLLLSPLLLVIAWGGFLYSYGVVTIGEISTIFLYVFTLKGPISEFTFWIDVVESAKVSFARIFGVGLVPPAEYDHDLAPAGREWELDRVSFAYGNGPEVLHQVSLNLAPGERLAIVGTSGAGKSTLARLLAGIDEPSGGQVLVGGAPIAALAEDARRAQVALVTQEHHIFSDTLAANLRLVKPEATDEELWEALDVVGAKWARELVTTHEGLETKLGSGELTLNAARAQQVALARLVLMDPHTLILDEATSMLDPTSAREIEQGLERVLAGRTVIMIAHRLFTAQDADRICVMENGQIAELGSHDELVAQGGHYAKLWQAWANE
ncbi:hypothetical protein BK816_00860 [Boudabousia tangfeifanii]|uniref:Multidrug ABC transporter ATP-binding protein n=1 Tax=Boudabousia tangfeifanii TaxID=1912795 RepID=A0A1D9MIJ0_9ACTO|nr:ABC transporter ATP-binding protein [Boudabousia tangfeifanii]AOZ72023.1 hypothetical protein BK816_00860 [Boudabousia tangfeifanii]